jgi:hypothetical protein
MKLTGENRSTQGKPCPSTTFSTTNPTSTDQGSNPGLRDERPATNRLSHGTALKTVHYYKKLPDILVIKFVFALTWRPTTDSKSQ